MRPERRGEGVRLLLGLPRPGGLLTETAIRLGAPVMVSVNIFSRWGKPDRWGVRPWLGFNDAAVARLDGIEELHLDSAGFVALSTYQTLPWPLEAYVAFAARHRFARFSSADYACEPELAATPERVRDRIAQTTRLNFRCASLAAKHRADDRFMPVIQSGEDPTGYLRSIEELEGLIEPGRPVGIGSMCRRDVASAVAAARLVAEALPDNPLHFFGLKSGALAALHDLGGRASADSQAYGVAARQKARKAGVSKTDAYVAAEMTRWYARQLALAATPGAAPVARAAPVVEVAPPRPAWEDEIERAREAVRELIRSGALPVDANIDHWTQAIWAEGDEGDEGEDDEDDIAGERRLAA